MTDHTAAPKGAAILTPGDNAMPTTLLKDGGEASLPGLCLMIGRVEGKLDQFLSRQEEDRANLKAANATLEAQEKRIDALERFKARLVGATAVISTLTGALVAIIGKVLTAHL